MTYTKETFIKMLQAGYTAIEGTHEMLSELDAATGDGDHGVTILRTMKAVNQATIDGADKSLAELVGDIAMQVMSCDGGSTSSLLGSYFMGFGMGAPADELDAEQTAAFFEAAFTSFQGISGASVGDKTTMDALCPATETLATELRASGDFKAAFTAAAAAAVAGAEKTKEYVAKFGRARTMGERAIGHQDAGATSMSIIWTAFAETL